MLLDLRSLEEAAAAVVLVGGEFGHVVYDSERRRPWRLPPIERQPDNLPAILALYASGALTDDEFAVLLAA